MTSSYVLAIDVALAVCSERAGSSAEGLYPAALGSRGWEAMVEVGEASARVGNTSDARRAYLVAFDRAHAVDSVEGTLRAAAALAVLGDSEAVGQMVRVAEHLAIRHQVPPAERARVRAEGAALVAQASVARQTGSSVR